MSGYWMTAAHWFNGYNEKPRGEFDRTTKPACQAILNRLAQRANDAGVAAVYIDDLMRSSGYSRSAVQRALAQLQRDGWIWQGIRGQGNRAGTARGLKPSPSVYALRPMPQSNGETKPSTEIIQVAWTQYARTDSYANRPATQRRSIKQAVQDAWTLGLVPVDNRIYVAEKGYLHVTGDPLITSSKLEKKRKRSTHIRAVPSLKDEPKESAG